MLLKCIEKREKKRKTQSLRGLKITFIRTLPAADFATQLLVIEAGKQTIKAV